MPGPATPRFARTMVAAVAVVLVGVPAGAASAATAGDVLLTPDATARNVAAYGGLVVWTRQDEQRQFRLVLRANGVASDLPVAPSPSGMAATLGPGVDGHPTLVYARAAGNRQTLMRFDTVTGVESPAAAPQSVGQYCKVMGAVNGNLLAYALAGRVSGTNCKLLLRVVKPDGRTLLTRRGLEAQSIALSPRQVAVTHGDLTLWMRVINLATKRSFVVAREDAGEWGGASGMTAPSFVGGRLYFARTYINGVGTYGQTLGPYKVKTNKPVWCASSGRSFGPNVLLDSFAVDPPNAYYTDGEHLYQTAVASLRFGPPRRGLCGTS